MKLLLDFLKNPDIISILSFVSLIGFLLTLISIVFIIINITSLRKQNETNIKIERNQRFQAAITQLGSDKDSVVLGAIYTLHSIAKEDKKYTETIFNILCSYVRDTTSKKQYQLKYINKTSEPILAILRLLCINKNEFKVYRNPSKKIIKYKKINIVNYIKNYIVKCNKSLLLDFSGAYLRGVDFSHVLFENDTFIDVDFTKSIFFECIFNHCELDRTIFIASNIGWCRFLSSNIEYSNFTGCNGFGVYFNNGYLNHSIFIGSYLEGAYFNSSIDNADFSGSYLRRTIFDNIGYHVEFVGASSCRVTDTESNMTFEERVTSRINKKTDLSCIGKSEINLSSMDNIFVLYDKKYADEVISSYRNHLKLQN